MNKRNIRAGLIITLAIGLCILLPTFLLNKTTNGSSSNAGFDDYFTFSNGFAIAVWVSLFLAHAFAFFATFERSVLWALAVIFVPFALIVFLVIHTQEAKAVFPFLIAALIFGGLHLAIS